MVLNGLAGAGVDPRDRAVDGVGHPHRARTHRHPGRAPSDGHRCQQPVVRRGDRYHCVVQGIGDPHLSIADRDRARRERQVDDRLSLPGEHVQTPEPPVHRVTQHPHRAVPDRQFAELDPGRGVQPRVGVGHQDRRNLPQLPAVGVQPIDERAPRCPEHAVPGAHRAGQQGQRRLPLAGSGVVPGDVAREQFWAVRCDVDVLSDDGQVPWLAGRGDTLQRTGLKFVPPEDTLPEVGHPDPAGCARDRGRVAGDRRLRGHRVADGIDQHQGAGR